MADPRICSVENCRKLAATRGWCHGHYHRWQRYGDPTGGSHWSDNSGECGVEGCAKSARAGGLCAAHYYHLRRNGGPLERAPPRESAPLRWLREHATHADASRCLQWPFATTEGRPSVRVGGATCIAAREMCRLAHGEPPTPEHHAAHSCGRGNDACINPQHLRWATASENEADKLEHGTSNRGVRHGMVKLDEPSVQQIRALKGVRTQRATAKAFGVSRTAVNDIWTGKTWGWLK